MPSAPRNDDGEIVEPRYSTVDDWLGQQVSEERRRSTSCSTRPVATWKRPSAGSGSGRTRTARTGSPPRNGGPEPVERSVLVTGAGSGIGLASAIEAARVGFRAVAAVHDPGQIAGVHAAAAEAGVTPSVEATVLDVTDDGATAELVQRVQPWAVVSSAGAMNLGLIEDVPIEDVRASSRSC